MFSVIETANISNTYVEISVFRLVSEINYSSNSRLYVSFGGFVNSDFTTGAFNGLVTLFFICSQIMK